MKTRITSQVVIAFAMVVVVSAISSTASAQRWVGANGMPVVNPNSGVTLDPEFNYYPETGLVTITNVGANGVVDSANNMTLGGDDYGMISALLSISSPSTPTTGVLPPFGDGIAWAAPSNFNGKIQLSGNAITASFLPVSTSETPIFSLPVGLTAADFRNTSGNVTVETGVNFNFGAAGSTLFSTGDALMSGAFNIVQVPEPMSIVMLGSALLGTFGMLRRRFVA